MYLVVFWLGSMRYNLYILPATLIIMGCLITTIFFFFFTFSLFVKKTELLNYVVLNLLLVI